MEVGETVILVNSAPIHSCFYDVFNRHFAVIAIGSVDDKKEDDGKKKEAEDDNVDKYLYPSVLLPLLLLATIRTICFDQ